MARTFHSPSSFSFSKFAMTFACLGIVGLSSSSVSFDNVQAKGVHISFKAPSVKNTAKTAFMSFGHRDTKTVIILNLPDERLAEEAWPVDLPVVAYKASILKPHKVGSRKVLTQASLRVTGLQLVAGGGKSRKHGNIGNKGQGKSGVAFREVAKPINGLVLIAGARINNNGVKIGHKCKNVNFCIVSDIGESLGAKNLQPVENVKVASVPNFKNTILPISKVRLAKPAKIAAKRRTNTGPTIIMLDEEFK